MKLSGLTDSPKRRPNVFGPLSFPEELLLMGILESSAKISRYVQKHPKTLQEWRLENGELPAML